MIRLLDTFAWVGGFHLALEQSIWKENIECIGYSEIDKFAKQVYNERFPWCKDLWSITEIDIDNLEDFDLLTWWFPCQSFSVAWKQWWFEDARWQMIYYLLNILEEKQHWFFVFENVKAFMGKKFQVERDIIFKKIYDIWYKLDVKILNTKDFWLPQNRERVFMVWYRMDWNTDWWLNFPQWQELTTFLKDILEEEVDEKLFLTERQLKSIKDSKFVQKNTIIQKDISWTLMARDYKDPKCTEILQMNNPRHSNNRIYNEEGISPTINTCWGWNRQVKIYPQYRKLSTTEYCRLQGFPDNWSTEFVSNSQAYKQMWNAISVPVVKSIFDNLLINLLN